MGEITDIGALCGSVQSTWQKIQADVVAHGIFLFTIFVVCGVSFPRWTLTRIDAARVTESPWFHLAKETGVLYLAVFIPLIAVSAYASLLRATGQVFSTTFALVFNPATSIARSFMVDASNLEPFALFLNKEDYGLDDLVNASTELALKYRFKKTEMSEEFNRIVECLSKNPVIYLGDFCVFLLLWVLIHSFSDRIPWLVLNPMGYRRGLFILTGLIGVSWFRVRVALIQTPLLRLALVSEVVRADPDMSSRLDISEEKRARLLAKLNELLEKEREIDQKKPSLLQFLMSRRGLERRTPAPARAWESGDHSPKSTAGDRAFVSQPRIKSSTRIGPEIMRPTFTTDFIFGRWESLTLFGHSSNILSPAARARQSPPPTRIA